MRLRHLATEGKQNSFPTVGILSLTKKLALRQKVWYKILSRVERAIIDLTLKYVDDIKSVKLAKLLTAIIDKLQSATESTIDRLVRTIGIPLAEKISCLATGWGNISAKSWASDRSFATYLAAMHASNDFRPHFG